MRTDPLRPTTLEDFGGQPDVTRRLNILLSAARHRDELADHILFAGPPGLGKTTLANIVASELSVPIHTTTGPTLEKPGDLAAFLSGIGQPSVVFIDEIHRLARPVEEILYPAMEDGVLDLTIGQGDRVRTVRVPLPPFTLIGATTQTGLLSAPLRDRFGYTARLNLYDEDDLADIVARSARLLELSVTEDATRQVATRSRGTPRVANALLRRVRDYAQHNSLDHIDTKIAQEALDEFGIDPVGLDQLGLRILEAICTKFNGGPVGANTLAAVIGESPATLEEVYEPYLLHLGFLARTPRGRIALRGAWEHLGLDPPEPVRPAENDDRPTQPSLL